jgi:threonine dehydratase
MITYQDILKAAERIRGAAHRTPVLTSRTFNQLAGCEVFFKAENLQRMGAFKFRGAYNKIASLPNDVRRRGIIAYSSGNHAQAVALSAKLFEIPAAIVMPADAPKAKIAATREYGAEVVLYDRYQESREAIGTRLSQERSMTLVPPFDDHEVMAGQGTAALELLEEVPDLETLVVCCSGCGLLAGCAVAARHLQPDIQIFGVEPETADDTRQSFLKGEIVTIPVPVTIADGLQTSAPGNLTFPIVRQLVKDILLVSDAELIATMKLLLERMKILVEPSGAAAAAAVLHQKTDFTGRRVGVIISGGNVDLEKLAMYIG